MSKKPKKPDQTSADLETDFKPPKHLGNRGRAFWCATVAEYSLRATHLVVLQAACECLDAADAARAQLAKEGLTVATRHGLKSHPCAALQGASLHAFVRLIRELGVKEEAGSAPRE